MNQPLIEIEQEKNFPEELAFLANKLESLDQSEFLVVEDLSEFVGWYDSALQPLEAESLRKKLLETFILSEEDVAHPMKLSTQIVQVNNMATQEVSREFRMSCLSEGNWEFLLKAPYCKGVKELNPKLQFRYQGEYDELLGWEQITALFVEIEKTLKRRVIRTRGGRIRCELNQEL